MDLDGAATLERVAAPGNLYRAWEAVRDRATVDGTPSAAVLAFSADPAAHLASIADELLGGRFRPSTLHRLEIPKRSGGMRQLSIPTIRDRVVERAVHHVLEPVLDPTFTPWSFGFRPGLGVRDAVAAVVAEREAGGTWALRCDFARCFDSLDRRRLVDVLAEQVADDRLLRLIRDLLGRGVCVGFRVERLLGGVPQGAPLSPLLCNLYLTAFDEAMLAYGRRPIRFADDVIVLTGSRPSAHRALAAARAEAGALGLELGEAKTQVQPLAAGVEYLGIRFDRSFPPRAQDEPPTPRSKALYVIRQGAWIGLSGGQVKVRDAGKQPLLSVPAEHVGQVVCCGSVSLSAGLRTEALVRSIDVVFLSRRGGYLGRLDSARSESTELRQAQYRRAADPEGRLAIARRLVAGKLANQRALLLRRHRRMQTERCLTAARAIEGRRHACLACRDLQALMGLEGAAAHAYFAAMGSLLDPKLGFSRRQRRPPRDPVNALLSLGYTLLLREGAGAVAAAGFDPNVGFLHSRERTRPSLALDLIEEFRAPVVDTVVLEALRGGVLGGDDFRAAEGGACLLTDEGMRRFLRAFEQRMLTTFAYVPSGQRVSYRRALFLQARQLAAFVQGLRDDYRPVSWR